MCQKPPSCSEDRRARTWALQEGESGRRGEGLVLGDESVGSVIPAGSP